MYSTRRTPWRTRLIIWPGKPFRTLPFPYLFQRWEVVSNETGWCGSFWSHSRATDRQAFLELAAEVADLEYRLENL